jgi:hypothetical protein
MGNQKEVKWTPGPWEVDGSKVCYDLDGTKDNICNTVWQEANAHLIAAAPDLYEALAEIMDWVVNDHPASVKARAALAKARGE